MTESLEKKVHKFLAEFDHKSSSATEYGEAFHSCEKEIVESLRKHGFDASTPAPAKGE